MTDIDQLAYQILQQDRRALARGITLVESQRSDHREQSIALVRRLGLDLTLHFRLDRLKKVIVANEATNLLLLH